MAYTGRHSYFLCFLQFVFRRSPARLAVKKYAHAKPEEDFFTCNQPEGPPCGTGLKNNYFCRKKWGWRIPSVYCLSGENLKFHAVFLSSVCLEKYSRIWKENGNMWYCRRSGYGIGNRKRARAFMQLIRKCWFWGGLQGSDRKVGCWKNACALPLPEYGVL